MKFILFLTVLVVVPVLCWALYRRYKRLRRERLFALEFPRAWVAILQRNLALYARLPEELVPELHGRIHIFLAEKLFSGVGGQLIDDEVRVTIAGTACLLLLKRDKRCFPGFRNILVYPDTFVAQQLVHDGQIVSAEWSARSGESWSRGPVVLSWNDVLRGNLEHPDGHNVVLHEFAHKLDEENEILDGLPVLRDSAHYAEWAQVFTREYASFQLRVMQGSNEVIDDYGAESPAEFFAVVTESFFEKSARMRSELPELYLQLKRFYGLDPAEWRK